MTEKNMMNFLKKVSILICNMKVEQNQKPLQERKGFLIVVDKRCPLYIFDVILLRLLR